MIYRCPENMSGQTNFLISHKKFLIRHVMSHVKNVCYSWTKSLLAFIGTSSEKNLVQDIISCVALFLAL